MNLRLSQKWSDFVLKDERLAHIVSVVHRQARVTVTALAAELGVSEDTVRRDLGELAGQGILQRVHGGAVLRPAIPPFAERMLLSDSDLRARLATEAAGLARDGQIIFLDSGTTVLAVARRLPAALHATFVTPSVPVAAFLADHPSIDVLIVGGRLDKAAQSTIGVAAVEAIRHVRADLCFLGICGLDAALGISVASADEAAVKHALISQAAEVVAIAEADKLGTANPYLVDDIRAITYLITDRSSTEATLEPYRERGVQVLQVS
jgi:DeoR/GlpR family transcriptional regulator of sugar metabolism